MDEIAFQGPTGASQQIVKEGWIARDIEAGTSTDALLNNFADEARVLDVMYILTGSPVNASSTYFIESATSSDRSFTANGLENLFFNEPFTGRVEISTSTGQAVISTSMLAMASSSKSILQSASGDDLNALVVGIATTSTFKVRALAQNGFQREDGLGTFTWQRGQWLNTHLLDASVLVPNGDISPCNSTAMRNGATGGYQLCENATSTLRGFNVTILIHYIATTTAFE